ncbi:hypothetical protein C095_05175 [Fusobacterium necrophorum subsp. funduliforme B35]|uniref:Uncharacterized protein n=1 Tax=Fusobacterium necrophorum subsp. funduliforme B35 TaxID=1226633 RepID=A0A0B4EJD3_9FUSO|nr:hypothetical protein C095_05175 [Fusobacterium necrophorum subsp. funduliforme B35]
MYFTGRGVNMIEFFIAKKHIVERKNKVLFPYWEFLLE